MMFVVPFAPGSIVGRYELEALERERQSLWDRRFRVSASEGARLDELLRRLGPVPGYEPVVQGFPPIDLSPPLPRQTAADRLGMEPFSYTERS